ncbi:MAG: hypothetical protein ACREF3_02685, partial [Acetobacteraceae bacterium]
MRRAVRPGETRRIVDDDLRDGCKYVGDGITYRREPILHAIRWEHLMPIQALGYLGIGTDRLDDWT